MDGGSLHAWCTANAQSLPGEMCGYFDVAAMNEWQARLRENMGRQVSIARDTNSARTEAWMRAAKIAPGGPALRATSVRR